MTIKARAACIATSAPPLSDARVDRGTRAALEYLTGPARIFACDLARAVLSAADAVPGPAAIRVTAIRDDAGYWIADQNDTQPENATLILDEPPR
jgi:hypothetical protein